MLKKTLLHNGWQFAAANWAKAQAKLAFSPLQFLPATVPGHAHLDLARAGVIAHPFRRMAELGCQWVDETEFVYRLHFEWSGGLGQPRRVLRFEGIDGVCSVSLNGQPIGEHDNMFVPLELDVSSLLVAGQNELCVTIGSSASVGKRRREEYFAREGLPTATEHFDERSFVRKAQYMYGWDWGPRLVSCGIWREVSLLEFTAKLCDVHVTQVHESDGAVAVRAHSTFEGRGTIIHFFDEALPCVGDGEVARLAAPRLWYPSGLGEQPRYELITFLCPEGFEDLLSSLTASEAREAAEAVALDRRASVMGLRRLELVSEPDEHGSSFGFRVNGKALWVFGANWVPLHSFPSQDTRAELRALLLKAKLAGMNMLRVWGGGMYESDDFYDLCDELGLFVWQDFPFACAYYPDDAAANAALRTEASENIVRLRNHPSLALWCGNNENLAMFQERWGDRSRHPSRFYGELLYQGVLPELVAELDPGRPYVPSSPHGASAANGDDGGDQHYWDVWHGRGDWVHYRDSHARFASEFGFAASCSVHAWAEALELRSEEVLAKLKETSVNDPVVRWHDKTGKDQETFVGFVSLHYPKSESLADWIYFSQLNQRDALRCAVEHYRRSRRCQGTLIWQLNDCWPVQSWAIIDSAGQRKPAWFELKRLYAPVLLGLHRDGSTLQAWLVASHVVERVVGTVELFARAIATGKQLDRFSANVEVAPGAAVTALEVDVSGFDAKRVCMEVRMGNLARHCLLCEPKELALGAPGRLSVCRMPGSIELRCEVPIIDLWLEDERGAQDFEQNCLTIAEPGTVEVAYVGTGKGLRARSLAGEHELQLS